MELKMLSLNQLKANGLRKRTAGSVDRFNELKESIKAKGVIFPLVATANGKGVVILDGNRRYEAYRSLGLTSQKLPVLIIKADEGQAAETALLANTVREDFDPLSQAETVNLLINSYGRSVKDVASLLGKTERYIRHQLSVFKLPRRMLEALRKNDLTLAHAHWLSKALNHQDILDDAFKSLIAKKMSARELETLISSAVSNDKADGYVYFPKKVVTTKAGSRLRFEARRRSVRVELNLNLDEPVGAVLAEVKKHLDALTKKRLKAVS